MKIRSHLTAMAVAILVPVVVFSALALSLLWNAQRAAALHGLQETARATGQNVDKELGRATAALKVLATSPNLRDGDLEAFYQQAVAADLGENTWVVLLDARGQQLVSTAAPYGAALPPPMRLEPILEVMRTGQPFISNLFIGRRTGTYVSTVNVPVPLDHGQRYVLTEVFEPAYFKRVFERNNVPKSWVVGILDREGRFIARNLDGATLVGQRTQSTLLDAIRTADSGDLRHQTAEGADVYSSFLRSPVSGWTVAVAAPMLEIDGSVRSALSVAGIGLLAALLLASALAALLGRRLAQSIAVASESAHALANGEPFPVAPSGITELDALHAAHRDAAQVLVQARHLRSAARAEREKLIHAEQVARRRAEADVVAKDNFMAMLGHELRNPLNAMTGAIGVLDDPHTPPAGRESAQRILRRQNRQLAHIVDDLLDFNRMALGKISLETVPVELCHAARMCLEAARTSGSRHRLTTDEGDCPVWVRADPTRLEQIISNLLGNAMKFSDPESKICLTVGRVGEQAQLLVGDQGIGIAADLLPLIFDPFVQGPATLDRARSGLGIGLSLVRQLVTLHGGGIAAASTGPGCGSVFTLHLPAIEAPVTVDSGAAPAAAAEPQRVSVLLVEDNPDSREMIRTLLEMHGFQVSEAGTGADGIALARSLQPAVAVVDVGLPDIDGYTVATTLCADRAARQGQPGSVRTGLIALTGYGQPGDRERALAAGFDVHLVKPLQLERLLAAIAACTEPAASISNQAS